MVQGLIRCSQQFLQFLDNHGHRRHHHIPAPLIQADVSPLLDRAHDVHRHDKGRGSIL